MSGRIRFLLGDLLIESSGFDPQLTVLDWLRNDRRRMGSKEGCAEGDCGACTVVVGELHDGALRYRALNACILLLATLDGKQLITVEDLSEDGQLHPVQSAMINQHGSQCGFCTPGFVMSLFAMFHEEERGKPPGRRQIDDGLAGNLCRCTGYVPIVQAAREALSPGPADRFERQREHTIRILKEIQPESGARIQFDGRQFLAPRSMRQLLDLLGQHPDAVMVAGATDVGLWITKQQMQMKTLVYTCNVPELQKISVDDEEDCLMIGAAVTYTDALDILTEFYPEFGPLLRRLGATQVRNAGTIGGNIANGSPIGDMPPPLIVLRARVVLSRCDGRRELDLEDFFIAYGSQDLHPGEILEQVKVPLPASTQLFRVYKLSKRFDQDISALCGAFALSLEDGCVSAIRICYGGMAGVPARARRAEEVLLGKPWNGEQLGEAMTALAKDFQALSDWRASSEYRTLSAKNLLQRFFLETTQETTVQLARDGRAR
jgi:xanthine dehydrogenase small subunit